MPKKAVVKKVAKATKAASGKKVKTASTKPPTKAPKRIPFD
jgi:hypothetical protein